MEQSGEPILYGHVRYQHVPHVSSYIVHCYIPKMADEAGAEVFERSRGQEPRDGLL